MNADKILGKEVKDKITGYKGIATCRCSFLQGCDRIEVAAPMDKDGKLPDMVTFDEPQLEVIGPGIRPETVKKARSPGGPHGRYNTSIQR
jgi:hypothetical protein